MAIRRKNKVLRLKETRRPFVIPEIEETAEDAIKEVYDDFVSPVYGRNVKKDNIVSLYDTATNMDKKYDSFRDNRKYSDDIAIQEHGTKYYEFNLVQPKQGFNNNLNKSTKEVLDVPNFFNSDAPDNNSELESHSTSPQFISSHTKTIEQSQFTSEKPNYNFLKDNEQVMDPSSTYTDEQPGNRNSYDFLSNNTKLPSNTYTEVNTKTNSINHSQPIPSNNTTKNYFEEDMQEDYTNTPDNYDLYNDHSEDNFQPQEDQYINNIIQSDKPVQTTTRDYSTTFNKPKKSTLNEYYELPSVDLLEQSQVNDDSVDEEWVSEKSSIINETLAVFGVKGHVCTYTKGPTITRFEIELELDVKVQKVIRLENDLKMRLAAKFFRIEAPIPGKTTIGIEIPNPSTTIVKLKDIVDRQEFKEQGPLSVALGIDIDGNPIYEDISKMPHGLIAGSTGSGKSVCVNTILASLLFKNRPQDLRLLLIDPKVIELSSFQNIPHLITPVVNDPKIASLTLKWAVEEMEYRYSKVLKESNSRNIAAYNAKAKLPDNDYKPLPHIVILIDEFGDLMDTSGKDVEESIRRLTQKARAAGMHLLLATQRPSADVISGTIKNNIAAKLAFAVNDGVSSRTILDSVGAEQLLGKGDMLLKIPSKNTRRVQGAYVSDEEIDRITDYCRSQSNTSFLFDQDALTKNLEMDSDEDELLEEVAVYVVSTGRASANTVQQRFSIGFNRASKIFSQLEQYGIISESQGSKPRNILVNDLELENILTMRKGR